MNEVTRRPTQDLITAPAIQTLCTLVPIDDAVVEIADHDRVLRLVEQGGLLPEFLLGALTLGNIARDAKHLAGLLQWVNIPRKPANGTVLAKIAIFETPARIALFEFFSRAQRGLAIRGQYEVQYGSTQELLFGPAQALSPCRIDLLESSVKSAHTKHVQRQLEQPVPFIFGLLALSDVPLDCNPVGEPACGIGHRNDIKVEPKFFT